MVYYVFKQEIAHLVPMIHKQPRPLIVVSQSVYFSVEQTLLESCFGCAD